MNWVLVVIMLNSFGVGYEEVAGYTKSLEDCHKYKDYTVWLHDKLSLSSNVICLGVEDTIEQRGIKLYDTIDSGSSSNLLHLHSKKG